MKSQQQIRIMKAFTETFKKNMYINKAEREARCLKVSLPEVFEPIQKDDWFVGRFIELPVGHSPQVIGQGLGYYGLERKFNILENDSDLTIEEIEQLSELKAFWKQHSTASKIESTVSENVKKYLPLVNVDIETNEIALPLYRLAGAELNFELLLGLGINGLINKIKSETFDRSLAEGMINVLETLKIVILNYKEQIAMLILQKKGDLVKLKTIANSLETIYEGKPKGLHSAIQLLWIYAQASSCYNYGRLDDVLAKFYINDLNNKVIDNNIALEYMLSLFVLISNRCNNVDGRIITGGKGRKNEEAADKLAQVILEATKIHYDIVPQVTLRFYEGQNPMLLDMAYDILGTGTTFPILYNDDVNIKSVSKALDVNILTAEQYVPYSCGEYIINHQSIGTPSVTLNLLKALETILFDGHEIVDNREMGIRMKPFDEYKSFEEFYQSYKQLLSIYIDACAKFQMHEYRVAAQENEFLLVSILYDECITRSSGVLSGGALYLNGALELYGNTNTADSLIAIKKLVFESDIISKQELLTMLKVNFIGFEDKRKLLLNCPKYGNDNSEVDELMCDLHSFVCNEIKSAGKKVGLHAFLAVVINNAYNTVFGQVTGASADGRLEKTFMANANNPTGGMDKSGITSMLSSIVKIDSEIHAGTVQNLKFSKLLFLLHLDKLKMLLKAYYDNGGTQAMISVVNQEDLKDAVNNPGNYPNLIVRVGGFSARFIELPRDIQSEILSRHSY